MTKQQEIIYSTFAQIEDAIEHRNETLMSEIKNLKTYIIELFLLEMKANFQKGVVLVCWELA